MVVTKSEQHALMNLSKPIYGAAIEYPNKNEDCNDWGFREFREYKTGQAIALGCSYTYGFGVNHEEAWPYQLEQLLNVEVYNFGVSGGAYDTFVRLAEYWVKKLQPKYVFLALIFPERYEIYHQDEWRHVLANQPNSPETLFEECNLYTNFIKNTRAMSSITRNTKLIVESDFQHSDRAASDNMHPGPEWHNDVANLFYDKLKGL